MNSQRNEKARLTANYLNGIAVAVALAGAFTPALSGIRDNPGPIYWPTAGVVAACMAVSVIFHLFARRALNALLD